MKYPWAFPGSKCVAVRPPFHWLEAPRIEVGRPLTIRKVMPHPRNGDILISFEEIKGNGQLRYGEDRWLYYARDFRPLIDTSKQIESMRELIKKAAREQRVSA